MTAPNELSIVQAGQKMRSGALTAQDLIRACLDRIDARESTVMAWTEIDADGALAQARACDDDAARGVWRGPLHGIPVGIKDIYDVQGLPTRGGTQAWPVSHPEHDAASVSRLRHAGAIILGKTVTTAFAMGDPGPTTNPWNSAHTPGGSSSGSAAAVADRMCLAALGTQTAGSVIRPCSFNGIAGLKPGHSRISVEGIIPLAWRLDHVGALTRDVADAELMWQVMRDDHDWRELAADDLSLVPVQPERPVRLWRFRDVFETDATPEVATMMDQHCALLASRGVEIIERAMPVSMQAVLDNHRIIMASEAAAAHADNYALHGELYPPNIGECVREGQQISAVNYLNARQHRRHAIDAMARELLDVDGAISPAATEAAPEGLSFTGQRTFNAPSSYLGLPVVTYPVTLNAQGLPLGVQIMGSPNREGELLSVGRWCEVLADFREQPGS